MYLPITIRRRISNNKVPLHNVLLRTLPGFYITSRIWTNYRRPHHASCAAGQRSPPANREGNPAWRKALPKRPSHPGPRPPRLTLCGDGWCWLWLRVLLGEGVGEGVPTPLWAGCGVVGAEVAGVMVFCRSARRASGKNTKHVHISLPSWQTRRLSCTCICKLVHILRTNGLVHIQKKICSHIHTCKYIHTYTLACKHKQSNYSCI